MVSGECEGHSFGVWRSSPLWLINPKRRSTPHSKVGTTHYGGTREGGGTDGVSRSYPLAENDPPCFPQPSIHRKYRGPLRPGGRNRRVRRRRASRICDRGND